MFDNENETNQYSENYPFYEDDDSTISKYQVDRRLKQSQLKRQVRKSKHQINMALFFSRIFLLVLLIFIIANGLSVKDFSWLYTS